MGSVVYYLKAIPWEVPGFSPKKFENELRRIHEAIRKDGEFRVTTVRFYAIASKE